MPIINLTPHTISILRTGSDPLVVPPTAPAARVAMSYAHIANTSDAVALYAPSWGDVTGLPAPREDTIYPSDGTGQSAQCPAL